MRNLNVKVLAEIAIVAAIAFVLDYIQGIYTDAIFPSFFANGGSIGIAMLPIMILSLRRGLVPGIICGALVGGLDLLDGFWTYSDNAFFAFLQVITDYILAYALVGLAGLFYKKIRGEDNKVLFILLACVVGGLGKYAAHVVSGILFWPNDAWGGFVIYSFLYNGAYIIPSIVLCSLAMYFIFKKNKQILIEETE